MEPASRKVGRSQSFPRQKGEWEMVYVGIDVSKAHLDVAVSEESGSTRYGNDDGGIRGLVEQMKARQATLVVLEATGGYQRKVFAELLAAGIPTVAVNPR